PSRHPPALRKPAERGGDVGVDDRAALAGWSGRRACLDVGQAEIVLPFPPVRGTFPGSGDGGAVIGDHSGVALPESRCLAPYLPLPAVEGHLVDAGDAA